MGFIPLSPFLCHPSALMPIERTLQVPVLTATEFADLDRVVMRHAYASQNQLGRLFDERVYENDLALRLRADGFEVHTQVPFVVVHGSFKKTYYLDLVVNGMLYELKVVSALLAEHTAQALHYAMLGDFRRAKLINFRSAKVQGELHYNAVTDAARHEPQFNTQAWSPLTSGCERLLTHVRSFTSDWGTHLDSRLYDEVLVDHFGGEARCIRRAPVQRDQVELGSHFINAHAPNHAFVVTALFQEQEHHREHLHRLVKNLSLQGLQWINFNRAQIEFTTLTK